jgi:lipopolysaccharide transport system permease protein
MLLFWLTPIIYDVHTVAASLKTVLYMNPVSYFVLAYQDALYYNSFSSPQTLTILIVLTFLSLVLGYSLFIFCKARFPEEV